MKSARSCIRKRCVTSWIVGTAVLACLLSSGETSDAHFVGLWIEVLTFKGEPGWSEDIAVVDVFAEFTNPDDTLFGVAGSPKHPLILTTYTGQGFFNSPFGGDAPPSQALVDKHPELNWDTFVTIGPAIYQPGSGTIDLPPGWPGLQGDPILIENSGWFTWGPSDIGRAGNYPDLRVRLARLVFKTSCAPWNISGSVNIAYFDADNGGQGTQVFGLVFGNQSPACPADFNHDFTVDILDLLALLAAWGTDPVGPPDCDWDGSVGILDLLALLANWGPCQ